MIPDLHVHTKFSFDSTENPVSYIDAAISAGIKTVGFSDHLNLDYFVNGIDVPPLDLDGFFAEIENLRKVYQGKIEILAGVECGYSKLSEKLYADTLKKYPFDYVINSVHMVDGDVDLYYPKYFEGKTRDEAYGIYFQAVLDSVNCCYDFEILGHLCYAERYAKYENKKITLKDYGEIIDKILLKVIERGVALELNTHLEKGEELFMPSREIFERYLFLGGKRVVISSDAHKLSDFNHNFDAVKQYLTSKEVLEVSYFEERAHKNSRI